jgi:hypothetical protein
MVRVRLLLLASLALAACGVPEARLRTGLVEAGLSPRMADCMAGRMADALSIAQLRRLGDLPRRSEAQSLDEYLHRVRALRDPQILSVTARAAGLCAAGLG